MHVKKITFLTLGLLIALWAQASELSEKLQTSDYVLLMRHTRAPGVGDPVGYTLEDCKTQRNLSAEGRQHPVVLAQVDAQGKMRSYKLIPRPAQGQL